MSHHDWLKLTDGGFTKPRSSELKVVDEALKRYHLGNGTPALLEALQGALLRWMQLQGQNWKSSVRNKHNAVDTLHKQVIGVAGVSKTGAGMAALFHARDESRAIVTGLFQGKVLVHRPGLVTKLAGNGTFGKLGAQKTIAGVAKDAKGLSGGTGAPSSTSAAAAALFRELVPVEITQQVTSALVDIMPGFMTEWAASLVPFAGVLVSGGGALVSTGTTLRAQWRVSDAQMHAQRTLSTDEPEKAFASLVLMLERERDSKLEGLAIGVAGFGGKLAGILADGGTATNAAIGLAAGVAKLVLLIGVVVRDILEKNAANRLMALSIVDARLFGVCPVMGAYLVCCAPTSVLVNAIFDDDKFYQLGMQDVVERAVKRHIAPLREQARRLVQEHRMHIPQLANHAGLLEVNKKELKRMMANNGKTTIGLDHFSSEDNI